LWWAHHAEAYVAAAALVKDGDGIVIDAEKRELSLGFPRK